MAQSIFNSNHFHNEQAAYDFIEAILWPNGPVCPHCGETKRINKMQGKATRIGLYKCYACRKQFTVKIGTIFEDSHLRMHIWLQAFYLVCSSKKGVSANQLHRTLGVTLKTAWFIGHRIREAMKESEFLAFGVNGGIVEADETFIGKDPAIEKKPGGSTHKQKVLSLVDRSLGRARSRVLNCNTIKAKDVVPILEDYIEYGARVITDDAGYYKSLKKSFERHDVVCHTFGEYVNPDDPDIHTNTIEGFFSIFKRGMKGIYQHCMKHHLHRYLAEFDFRYNYRIKNGFNDVTRTEQLLKGVVGRRLTYQRTNSII